MSTEKNKANVRRLDIWLFQFREKEMKIKKRFLLILGLATILVMSSCRPATLSLTLPEGTVRGVEE